jgi:hypothetical protein
MNVCNNATAVLLFLFLINKKKINDSSAENLTGLKQSTDIMLVILTFIKKL